MVDGGGHNLINFPLRARSGASDQLTALFYIIASTATVSNINLKANTAIPKSVTSGYIGLLSYQNNGTIKNCVVSGGDIETTDSFGFGGIAYDYTGTTARFEDCTNTVNVKTSGAFMGGIVGGSDNSSRSITAINCNNTGNIESSDASIATYVGGIAGISAGEITNCSSSGNVTISNHSASNAYVGGLVGYARVSSKMTGGEFGGKVSLDSSTSNGLAVGGAVGFGNASARVTILGFRLTSEAEVNWVSGDRIPWMGGVVGRLTGNNDSLGDITLPGSTETITGASGSVIWGAEVYGTLNLWRDSSSASSGGVGGILGGMPSSDNSPTINIMNSTVDIKINIVDTTQNETGIFPIGGVVGYCAAADGQGHTLNVSNTKVNFSLAIAQTPSAYVGGIFGYVSGNGTTLSSINNEFNGTINDGFANSVKTGKTAGFVQNPTYRDLTCGGTGTASSGKYTGTGSLAY